MSIDVHGGTLLFGARDEEHNNVVVIKEILEGLLR
jgi:uncharacterized protein YeaO (DUF488 family)